jgi:hypothetical protein
VRECEEGKKKENRKKTSEEIEKRGRREKEKMHTERIKKR